MDFKKEVKKQIMYRHRRRLRYNSIVNHETLVECRLQKDILTIGLILILSKTVHFQNGQFHLLYFNNLHSNFPESH